MVDEGLADGCWARMLAALNDKMAAAERHVPVETIRQFAEVVANGKPGLAVGGGMAVTGTNATPTIVAINLLNLAAGNVGKTVRFGPDSGFGKVTPYAEVARLIQAMVRAEIELLLLGSGVNPAYTLPGGLRFTDALKKVGLVVSFANQPDETTALAHVVLPDAHWLESWGDYAPREGVVGLMQPTTAPVRDSRPIGDTVLAMGRAVLGSEEGKGPLPWATLEQYLKAAWAPVVKDEWAAALRLGGVWKETPPVAWNRRDSPVNAAPPTLEGDAAGLAVRAYPSFRFYDGRGASHAWLQETPDTMTQAVWDPWVEIAVETAVKLGIVQGDVVRLTSPYGSIELPAYVSPTLHPRAVAVPIGHRYAPYHTPRYVTAPAGSRNPVALLGAAAESASGGPAYLGVRGRLAKTGARRPLPIPPATHHHPGRELPQSLDLGAPREQALRGKPEHEEYFSMYPDQKYPGYRWGMAIDVDACV